MSDSDDTDLLLLIPPDFFLAPSSDLDDEVGTDNFALDDDQWIDEKIVNKLICHVNELETRVSNIENIDTSRQSGAEYYGLDTDPPVLDVLADKQSRDKFNSMSNPLNLLSGSIDNFQARNLENRNVIVSPPRQRQPFSLPSTPCYDIYSKIDFLPSRLSLNENNFDVLSKEVLSSEVKTSNTETPNSTSFKDAKHSLDLENTTYPCYQSSTIDSLARNEQKELLGEIDQYLGEVERHGGILQNKNNSVHIQSLTVNSLQSNRESSDIKETSVGLNMSNEYNATTHLDLPEVDRLLKEIECTQNEIEQKIKLHSPPKKLSTSKFNLNSQIKENSYAAESIRDTGFSTKENDERSGNSFTRRPLRSSLYSPRSRKKLDMNYKFKPLDKQVNLDSNQRLQEDEIKKIFMNSSIENNVDLLKNAHAVEPSTDTLSSEKEKQFQSHRKTESIGNTKSPAYSHCTAQSLRITNAGNGMAHLSSIKDSAYGSNSNTVKQPVMEYNRINLSNEKQSVSNLLSLTDLWNKEPTFYSDDPNKLRQKLEEEKYRRQHCEEIIKNLQGRVLEEQEKLAVAVRVDQEKDKAIVQLTDAWRKLVKHWGELEEQRHSLAQQLQTEREMSRSKLEDMTKKINRWETEVAQALDLAAGYKEKCEDVRKEKDALKLDLKTRIEEAEKQIQELCHQNEEFAKERNQMIEEVEQHRKSTTENNLILEDTQIQLEQLKTRFTQSEAEINVLKEQKEALSLKLKDEKSHASALEQQKIKLMQLLEESKQTEKASKDEARMFSERMDVARTELRALYQGQLDAVVKEKLKEFQNQLNASEAAFKADLLTKEKLWAEKSNNQCKLLSEKYKSELQQVHNQYKEEFKSWRMKLMEYERLKTLMENKLQEENNRRSEIAQRLHAVMENQWKQALNIITNPNCVGEGKGSQSGTNLYLGLKNSQSRESSIASAVANDDIPFGEDGRATYRLADPLQQDQLKKYIEMLLARGPGNLGESNCNTSVAENPLSPGSSIGGKWSAFMPFQDDKKLNGEQDKKANGKPPWK